MELSPIQKLENLLLVSVPRDLMDEEVISLRREVVKNVRHYHSRWALLDFSQVDICDSFFGRFIQTTAEMAGLMGTQVIVSGLQDAVIETMVELGMILPNIQAVLDLDDALALSREAEGEPERLGLETQGSEAAPAGWLGATLDEWAGPSIGESPSGAQEVSDDR